MTDLNVAPEQAGEPIAIVEAPADTAPKISVTEAARALRAARKPKEPEQAQPARLTSSDAQPAVPARPDPAPAEPAPPPVEAQGEQQTEQSEPAAEPPIDPPRSWTKEQKERFSSLPRETQEYLAEREQERDRELRRGQNEAAEQRKALEVERQKAEQQRTQYEQALPQLLSALEEQQAGQFGDIRTIADVEKLAREDWPRYVQWDAQQKRLAAVNQQIEVAKQRQTQEKQTKLAEFAKREAELLLDRVPELKDATTRADLQSKAIAYIKQAGFTDQELGELYNGQKELSLHDHRVQSLILDGLRYRQGKSAIARPSPRAVPPVQRPGVNQPRPSAVAVETQSLADRLDKTGNLRDAAKFLAARRRAAS